MAVCPCFCVFQSYILKKQKVVYENEEEWDIKNVSGKEYMSEYVVKMHRRNTILAHVFFGPTVQGLVHKNMLVNYGILSVLDFITNPNFQRNRVPHNWLGRCVGIWIFIYQKVWLVCEALSIYHQGHLAWVLYNFLDEAS